MFQDYYNIAKKVCFFKLVLRVGYNYTSMRKCWRYLQANPLNFLLIAFPLAILSKIQNWNSISIFSLSAIGVIPFAGLIGESTEALASYTGPKLGGLLNATLGNAAELIITLTAIRAGLLELVKAFIIFNQFELLALGAGVLIAALVSADGESNWLEGSALLAVYLILGLAFFFLPG